MRNKKAVEKKPLTVNEAAELYAGSLNGAKVAYTKALEKLTNEGTAPLNGLLKEFGLDGDVIYKQTGQRGVLEIRLAKQPLNGDFVINFYPYKKDGSRYTTSTVRSTIIPDEAGTIRGFLGLYEKAPEEPVQKNGQQMTAEDLDAE